MDKFSEQIWYNGKRQSMTEWKVSNTENRGKIQVVLQWYIGKYRSVCFALNDDDVTDIW